MRKKFGLIPLLIFIAVIATVALFKIGGAPFEPPYLQFILQAIFLFGASIAIAVISARAYLASGSINVLLLGSAIFISGLSSTIASWAVTLSANEAVTIGNLGILVSSFIILLSAITISGISFGYSNRKLILVSLYLVSLFVVLFISLAAAFDLTPDFITSTGPTPIRLVVLTVSILLYVQGSIMFGARYWRFKSHIVYWFALALSLFSLALIAAIFTMRLGDTMNWVSRLALYLSGVYFLMALVSRKAEQEIANGFSTNWADAFRLDREQSEKLFESMLNGFMYCKIEIDLSGKPIDWIYLEVNAAYEKIMGINAKQVIGRKYTDLFPKEAKELFINKYGHVALTGQPAKFEVYRESMGKWLNISAYSPKQGYFVSIFEDVTERKEAEEELKESEERLERSQEIAHLGSWELDLLKDKLTWSDEVYRIFGLAPQEFGATYEAFLSYVHPDDRSAVDCAYSGSVLEGRDSYEIEHRVIRKDTGEIRFVYEKCAHFKDSSGKVIRSLGMVHDVTERLRVENALRTSEEKFSKAFKNSPSAVTITRLSDGKIIDANDAVIDILGYDPEEAIGKTTLDLGIFANPNDRINLVKVLAENGFAENIELDLIRKDGNKVTVNLSASLIDIQEEKCFISSFIDITERKKAEKALKESEELFSKAFHSISFPVSLVCIADNRYIDANEAFLQLIEFSREEVVGHTSKELDIFPRYDERQTFVDQILAKGYVHNQEIDMRSKSRKALRVLFSVEAVTVSGQLHMLSSLIDITERKRLQKEVDEYTKNLESLVQERTRQLKDAERLVAIGATAGMVGHDIRNPLQAITSDVFLIKSDLESSPECKEKVSMKESLTGIEKNVDYINKIVADLQDFARSITPSTQAVDLRGLCEEVLFKIPANIKATCNVEDQAATIVSDSNLLKRILSNLTINAVQAMPNGGKLAIRAYKNEGNLIITVKDTGVGIPEEVKDKLFTPMFTTKSKGQGFGLAVVKRMTEALGGNVTYESKVGRGTTFILRFPDTNKRLD